MPCSLGVPGCGQQVAETEPAGAGLHKCTKCRRVAYCCKTCQVEAWRSGHKQECKALQARGAGAGLRDAQETVRAALTGKTDRRVVAQQQRVFYKMVDLFDAGNYTQVEEMAEEGLAVAETMLSSSQLPGAPGIVARIYRMVGHSYSERCDHIKGLRLLEQARELAVQVEDRPLLARVYHCLGCLRQRTGEYEEAIEMDEQARIIAVEHGLHEDEGVACSSLGVNYELMMQYEKAMKYYEEAVAIHGSHRGQRLQQASARSNIGRLLFKQGQRRKAVACMKQAWDVAMEEDNASLKASSSVLLGKGLWLQVRDGDLEAGPDAADHEDCPTERADTMQEAETWLRTALDLATEHNFLSSRQTAQMDLAFLTFVQGKEGVAVDLVTQHLQGFVDMGRNRCASCFQLRGDDAPMLTCDGCRVVRCVRALPRAP